MYRTQILLEEHQYLFLQSHAQRHGKSLSALLREMVDERIRAQALDPLWDIVGMAEGEPKPIAREHDRYLYGDKS